MGSAVAGPCGLGVGRGLVGRRRCTVRHTDRRVLVSIAELDAEGDQLAARPWHNRDDIEIERAADRTLDRGPQVGFAELAVLAAADQRKSPMVAAVDGDDGGEGAFRPDEDEAIGWPRVVQLFEAGAA